jgi:hypothetical protein
MVSAEGIEPSTFHLSHIPANANSSPPLTSKQYGCLALRVSAIRKTRQPERCTGEP